MINKRALLITGFLALIAIIPTTFAASIAVLIGATAMDLMSASTVMGLSIPVIPVAWWVMLAHHWHDARYQELLFLTFILPYCFVMLVFVYSFWRARRRRIPRYRKGAVPVTPQRSGSNLHGSADWMTVAEARKTFPGGHPIWGGIPVGEAYCPHLDKTLPPYDPADPATWGEGGRADLLLTPLTHGPISGLIVAGAGSGKTTEFSITTCATWFGSLFVMDPSCQVAPMVEGFRKSLGHTVVQINKHSPELGSTNVLRCIDIHDPSAASQIAEFVDWCAVGSSEDKSDGDNKFFADSAKELQECLLHDLLYSDLPMSKKTVREWRKRLTIPERDMPMELNRIFTESNSETARQLASTLMTVTSKTWSGIYKNATTATKWLSTPVFANLLSDDTYDMADICHGRMSIFLHLSDDDLKQTPGLGRVIVGSLIRTILRAKGNTRTPIPMVMDEVDLLRYMSILGLARDIGRKSGIALFPMWQSVGQIEATWGKEGKRSWYASAAWRKFASINDEETAEEVSKRCGRYTVQVVSEGQSTTSGQSTQRGVSDNLSEQPKEVISAYSLQAEMRGDEGIIIPQGKPAWRGSRSFFWRRPEIVRLFENDPYRRAA